MFLKFWSRKRQNLDIDFACMELFELSMVRFIIEIILGQNIVSGANVFFCIV